MLIGKSLLNFGFEVADLHHPESQPVPDQEEVRILIQPQRFGRLCSCDATPRIVMMAAMLKILFRLILLLLKTLHFGILQQVGPLPEFTPKIRILCRDLNPFPCFFFSLGASQYFDGMKRVNQRI